MKHIKSTLIGMTLAALAAWAGPTVEQLAAFQALAEGGTQWPVYQVETGKIILDGKIDEAVWAEEAHAVYMTGESMWSAAYYLSDGVKDAVTRWRFLYDREALYIACEFLDDFHVEGDGLEPWWNNDGVDITLFSQTGVVPVGAPVVDALSFLRFWRRFTVKPGLFGLVSSNLGLSWVPRDPRNMGWSSPEPEGSARLGGITVRCLQLCSDVYAGAWAMEIKVPITALFGVNGSGYMLDGRTFKMNAAFTDDDDPIKNDRYGVYASSHRYHPWWQSSDTAQTISRFCPFFTLAGFRGGPGRVVLPDEINLYCGIPPQHYQLIFSEAIGVCAISIERENTGSDGLFFLNASPNPFYGASEIRFAAPGRQAAFRIFDARGLLIRDLGHACTGRVLWDGRSNSGMAVAPGAYILRMDAGKESRNLKLTVIK